MNSAGSRNWQIVYYHKLIATNIDVDTIFEVFGHFIIITFNYVGVCYKYDYPSPISFENKLRIAHTCMWHQSLWWIGLETHTLLPCKYVASPRVLGYHLKTVFYIVKYVYNCETISLLRQYLFDTWCLGQIHTLRIDVVHRMTLNNWC